MCRPRNEGWNVVFRLQTFSAVECAISAGVAVLLQVYPQYLISAGVAVLLQVYPQCLILPNTCFASDSSAHCWTLVDNILITATTRKSWTAFYSTSRSLIQIRLVALGQSRLVFSWVLRQMNLVSLSFRYCMSSGDILAIPKRVFILKTENTATTVFNWWL